MNEAQKIKHELKDVVSVFLSKSGPTETKTDSRTQALQMETQILSFCSPFHEEITFACNALFPASQAVAKKMPERYFITETLNPSAFRFLNRLYPSLAHEKPKNEMAPGYFWIQQPASFLFEESKNISGAPIQGTRPVLICLDFVQGNRIGFEPFIKVLDQLVLVLSPSIEDLVNAYKVIKTCYYLNRQIDIFMIFNASMTPHQVEVLFTRFSQIVGEFLALSIRCLGAAKLDLKPETFDRSVFSQMNFDPLFSGNSLKQKQKGYSLERIKFLQKIKEII